jgi:hypothetical protein
LEKALRLEDDPATRLRLCNEIIERIAGAPTASFLIGNRLVAAAKSVLLEITPPQNAEGTIPRPETPLLKRLDSVLNRALTRLTTRAKRMPRPYSKVDSKTSKSISSREFAYQIAERVKISRHEAARMLGYVEAKVSRIAGTRGIRRRVYGAQIARRETSGRYRDARLGSVQNYSYVVTPEVLDAVAVHLKREIDFRNPPLRLQRTLMNALEGDDATHVKIRPPNESIEKKKAGAQ